MSSAGSAGPARGAYGVRLSGLHDGARGLQPVPADWPLLQLERGEAPLLQSAPEDGVRLDDTSAWLWLPRFGTVELRRDPLHARFLTAQPLSDEALLHPFLGIPAAIVARWLGRHAVHGGAVVAGERAWGLLGDREAGKSSLVAAASAQGAPVISDDILVTDGRQLFAGPRSVDLREQPASLLGGRVVTGAGHRVRWRLDPPAGAPVVELAGFVHLQWGEVQALTPVGAEERLATLIESSVVRPDGGAARQLLELSALPAWRFTRPRGLDRLSDHAAQLLEALA